MKTFLTILLSLTVGCVVGVMAAYNVANKKADEKIKDELAEYRRAARAEENVDVTVSDADDTIEKEEGEKSEMNEYEKCTDEYKPSVKPYILEDKDEDYLDSHKYLDDFNEIEVVYDKSRGRAADEDGCEIDDIRGTLGFNNVNKLFTTYKNKKAIHIICERDGLIYIVHAGNLNEFLDLDEEEEDDYDA